MSTVALAISAAGVPWALVATFVLGPRFERMFADFGGALPRLTIVMLQPWAPLALALGCFALVAVSTRVAPKWLPVTIAAVTLVAQPLVFLVAMYLPIFSLAGQIK